MRFILNGKQVSVPGSQMYKVKGSREYLLVDTKTLEALAALTEIYENRVPQMAHTSVSGRYLREKCRTVAWVDVPADWQAVFLPDLRAWYKALHPSKLAAVRKVALARKNPAGLGVGARVMGLHKGAIYRGVLTGVKRIPGTPGTNAATLPPDTQYTIKLDKGKEIHIRLGAPGYIGGYDPDNSVLPDGACKLRNSSPPRKNPASRLQLQLAAQAAMAKYQRNRTPANLKAWEAASDRIAPKPARKNPSTEACGTCHGLGYKGRYRTSAAGVKKWKIESCPSCRGAGVKR